MRPALRRGPSSLGKHMSGNRRSMVVPTVHEEVPDTRSDDLRPSTNIVRSLSVIHEDLVIIFAN
jgi:hypothetical protein